MKELPENKFGYLSLYHVEKKSGILIKANKIISISHYSDTSPSTMIDLGGNVSVCVKETFDEIIEQLENIHPNLR